MSSYYKTSPTYKCPSFGSPEAASHASNIARSIAKASTPESRIFMVSGLRSSPYLAEPGCSGCRTSSSGSMWSASNSGSSGWPR